MEKLTLLYFSLLKISVLKKGVKILVEPDSNQWPRDNCYASNILPLLLVLKILVLKNAVPKFWGGLTCSISSQKLDDRGSVWFFYGDIGGYFEF